ncbi:MAG: hypothetical protein P4L77_03030 [Sulfuriferula sp.]|nr:hypothetical protein [Sulfuriferula sp.]
MKTARHVYDAFIQNADKHLIQNIFSDSFAENVNICSSANTDVYTTPYAILAAIQAITG